MTTKANSTVINLVTPAVPDMVLQQGTLDGITLGSNTPGSAIFTTAAIESVQNNYVLVGQGSNPIIGLQPGIQNQVLISNGPTSVPSFSTFAIKTRLQGNYIYYVSPTGNDSNPGTETEPWLTLSHAYEWIVSYIDMAGYQIIVSIADGTYSAPSETPVFTASGAPDGLYGSNLQFIGNVGNPLAVELSAVNSVAVSVDSGASFLLSGVTVTATGNTVQGNNAGYGIIAYADGTISINNICFYYCEEAHMNANGGFITLISEIGATYSIIGDASVHVQADTGGVVYMGYSAVEVMNNPTFSFAFAVSSLLGSVNYTDAVLNGTAIGQRYYTDLCGVISVGGAGPDFFPGTIAGTSAGPDEYA